MQCISEQFKRDLKSKTLTGLSAANVMYAHMLATNVQQKN